MRGLECCPRRHASGQQTGLRGIQHPLPCPPLPHRCLGCQVICSASSCFGSVVSLPARWALCSFIPFPAQGFPWVCAEGRQAYPNPLCRWPLSWGLSSTSQGWKGYRHPGCGQWSGHKMCRADPLPPGWGSQEQHWREGQEPTWV